MPRLESPIVSVDWLNEHASESDLVVADVRPVDAYLAGHIPGAIHADLSTLRLTSSSPETIAAWTGRLQAIVDACGFGPGKSVVFYENASGTMAAYGVWLLDAAGQENGAMLDGGVIAWDNTGLPLSTDQDLPQPTSSPIQPNLSAVATADQILESLNGGGGGVNLVDSRAAHEFGWGSIPGAVNVEWSRHLDPDGSFKPLAALESLYSGLDKSEPIASYCTAGIRAANTYVVLRALGFAAARNYAPSWSEWEGRPDTPRARRGTSGG